VLQQDRLALGPPAAAPSGNENAMIKARRALIANPASG
jgi:hypothetical protein